MWDFSECVIVIVIVIVIAAVPHVMVDFSDAADLHEVQIGSMKGVWGLRSRLSARMSQGMEQNSFTSQRESVALVFRPLLASAAGMLGKMMEDVEALTHGATNSSPMPQDAGKTEPHGFSMMVSVSSPRLHPSCAALSWCCSCTHVTR